MNGLLLVDKPAGMTSHDVVDRIRKASGIRKVGHTGTLDPSATGLLVLCLGKATRLSEHLTGLDKVYDGIMRLGLVTSSHDLDGETLESHEVPDLDSGVIQKYCDAFTGELEQIPPMVSAVKVGGQRLYKLARKGETVDRPARKITVHKFEVLSYESPDVHIRISCTSGTYVRTLCHDIGQVIGCGGVLASLRRIQVGQYHVDQALALDAFTDPGVVTDRLMPMDDALGMPEVVLRASSRLALASGHTLHNGDLTKACPVQEGWVQVKDGNNHLLALAQVQGTAVGVTIHPKRVLI